MVAALSLAPLAFVLLVAYDNGWSVTKALIFRPRVAALLLNTVLLEICVLPTAIALSLALAWLTERSDLPGARFWAWLCVAPLSVPAFVHSYAWVSFWPGLNGLPAGTLVSVLAYFPFLYLPIAAQLRRLDPALEDAAASLGYSGWRAFLLVVLPQLRLALCGGSLLIGLHLLAEYGLYAMLRFDTFTTAIVDQFQSAYNSPAANLLGGVLVACCLGLMAIEFVARGDERYARVGSGAARHPVVCRLGRATVPCVALIAGVAVLSIGVPLVTLARWLAAGSSVAWPGSAIVVAFGETMLLAALGAVMTTMAALPMAWLSVRGQGRLPKVLEACHIYVGALPGVVIALALVTFTVRVALPLYQTMFTLIIAYVLMFLPRALIALRASIAQAPVEFERAAMALGRSPTQAILQVTLRLAAPGAAAGMALVGLGITNELTATLMLAPNGTRTLATEFWALCAELDYAAAAPYAAMMIGLSLPMTAILYAQSKRTAGR